MMPRKAKTTDPIFGLIAAHKKALTAEDKAEAALERLKERLDKRKDQRDLHRERRLTCKAPLFDIGGSRHDPFDVIRGPNHLEQFVAQSFERMANAVGPVAARLVLRHRKAVLRTLLRRYEAFRRDHAGKRKAVGLTALEAAVEATYWPACDARDALFAKAPATADGRKALAAYLSEQSPKDVPWWAMKKVLPLLAG